MNKTPKQRMLEYEDKALALIKKNARNLFNLLTSIMNSRSSWSFPMKSKREFPRVCSDLYSLGFNVENTF